MTDDRKLIARFVVPGDPASKSRARFTKRGSKTFAYTPEATRRGEEAVSKAFLESTGRKFTDKEAAYSIRAVFYKKTHHKRDVDNMLKLVLDGLTGYAYPDDNQVLEVSGRKVYVGKDNPRTEVEIYQIGQVESLKVPCDQCGKPFRTYPSQQTEGRRVRYCSKKCRQEAPQWGREDTACDYCGVLFSKQKCYIRNTNFCSHDCLYANARRKGVKAPKNTCQDCGGRVSRKEYQRCHACSVQARRLQASGKPKQFGDQPGTVITIQHA